MIRLSIRIESASGFEELSIPASSTPVAIKFAVEQAAGMLKSG
jgi:hypothetical protein